MATATITYSDLSITEGQFAGHVSSPGYETDHRKLIAFKKAGYVIPTHNIDLLTKPLSLASRTRELMSTTSRLPARHHAFYRPQSTELTAGNRPQKSS
jgi:hypothetical protein